MFESFCTTLDSIADTIDFIEMSGVMSGFFLKSEKNKNGDRPKHNTRVNDQWICVSS